MENIKKLFNEKSIDAVSACRYSSIADRLIDCRAKKRIPDNPQSVIVCLFPYLLQKYEERNISRYACVWDYHEIAANVLGEICQRLRELYPNNKFEPFADNSPIPEVYAAALSGLGVIGENGLLINKKYGSWVFIGEIVTDLKLDIEEQEIKSCIKCGKCADACIGGAVLEKFNRDNCISHITQKKRDLTDEEIGKIKKGGLVWGCDRCQEICPMNKNAAADPFIGFREGIITHYEPHSDISHRAFEWRGEKVMLRNYNIIYDKNSD